MTTESALRDDVLRRLVRQHLQSGQLPVMVSTQIAAGHGSGHVCSACAQSITSTQFDYEVEDERNGGRLHFHPHCHSVWQLECARSRPDKSLN